jgi:hypothetical protein
MIRKIFTARAASAAPPTNDQAPLNRLAVEGCGTG